MQRRNFTKLALGEHHRHVCNDGPKPTGMRYCNDGLALNFIPKKG